MLGPLIEEECVISGAIDFFARSLKGRALESHSELGAPPLRRGRGSGSGRYIATLFAIFNDDVLSCKYLRLVRLVNARLAKATAAISQGQRIFQSD